MKKVVKVKENQSVQLTPMTVEEMRQTNGGSLVTPIIDIIVDGIKKKFPTSWV